jgi:hypothetical protein
MPLKELRLHGDVLLDGVMILSNLSITLFESKDPKSRLKSWTGCFTMKSVPDIDLGTPYRLDLSDGRSGDIFFIRKTYMDIGCYFIGFRVANSLS